MTLIKLSARRIGEGAVFSRPLAYYVDSADVKTLKTGVSGSEFTDTGAILPNQLIDVFESPPEVRAAINVASGDVTGMFDKRDVFNGVSASGTNQATATPLTKYFNKISAVVISTVDGVSLPASPSVGDVCVVLNDASATLEVFPHHANAKIDAESAAAAYSGGLAIGQSVNFVCTTAGDAGTWESAIDDSTP